MKSSIRRKEASEQKLKNLQVPLNKNLPRSVDENEVTLRSKEEIIDRLIALTIVSAKALEAPPAKLEDFIGRYNANELFTAKEQMFISNKVPDQIELIQYSWKPECICVLLWSLNLIPTLDVPSNLCNTEFVFKTVLSLSKQEILDKSTVKSMSEILDELDFIYRAHWTVREAQLKHMNIPLALNPGVVYERHYTLNWLVNFMEEDWDDVRTHT